MTGVVLCALALLAGATEALPAAVQLEDIAEPPASARELAVEALLRLHNEQRAAHVLGDAALLTDRFADGFVEVGRGRVTALSPQAARQRFTAYLGSVRFLEWEDMRPPRIRVSGDGDWAEVIVQKRVRTIPADTTQASGEGAAVFAWAGRWSRSDTGAWTLATMASTDGGAGEVAAAALPDRVRAWEVLHRARESLGGEAAVARIATLRFVADCEGPGGAFVTEVASARDGRVSFRQRFPSRPAFGAGVSLAGPWQRSGSAPVVDSLDAVLGTVVAAHEVHLLALAPESRYTAPVARPPRSLDGREAHVVALADALGAAVEFFYDAESGLPVAFRPVNHTGRGPAEITTRLADWRTVGDVRLPFDIVTTQGEDVFRCRVTEASTEWLSDPAFRP